MGGRWGKVHLPSALATLAYDGRRAQFAEEQLLALLTLAGQEDWHDLAVEGSWAGGDGGIRSLFQRRLCAMGWMGMAMVGATLGMYWMRWRQRRLIYNSRGGRLGCLGGWRCVCRRDLILRWWRRGCRWRVGVLWG
nr:lytic murein transglycosylase [Rappaport israeli]